jgi:hypothetical protein
MRKFDVPLEEWRHPPPSLDLEKSGLAGLILERQSPPDFPKIREQRGAYPNLTPYARTTAPDWDPEPDTLYEVINGKPEPVC